MSKGAKMDYEGALYTAFKEAAGVEAVSEEVLYEIYQSGDLTKLLSFIECFMSA